MKASEILRKAADRLEPEGRWCQGELAMDSKGRGLMNAKNADACRWCMGGAMIAEGSSMGLCAEDEYLDRAIGCEHYVDWNDDPARTQPEVVAALRKAAELAEAEGM